MLKCTRGGGTVHELAYNKFQSVVGEGSSERYSPSFKSRSISRHSREIAVMEPIENSLFLRKTSITLLSLAFGTSVHPKREAFSIFRRFEMVLLDLSQLDRIC